MAKPVDGPNATGAAMGGGVGVPEGSAALLPLDGKPVSAPLIVRRDFTLIGSRNRARWRLDSPEVSRSHAALILSRGTLYIRDLGSRTHTFVNEQIVDEAELRHGDLLRIGNFRFKIHHPSPEAGSESAPTAGLSAAEGQAPLEIAGRTLLIGHRVNCDLVLASDSVSNLHAILFELNGSHHIRDLFSRTGTFVNDTPVKQQELRPGDMIRIGQAEFRYELMAMAQLEADAELLEIVEPEELEEIPEPQFAETSEPQVAEESEPPVARTSDTPLALEGDPLTTETELVDSGPVDLPWAFGCDQGSYVGGLPLSWQYRRALPAPPEAQPLPLDPAPPERKTTVIRGKAARDSNGRRLDRYASASSKRGIFGRLKRILGLSKR